MAARIAHEVRNPLVSIGAAAQVVAEELPSDSPVRGEALAIAWRRLAELEERQGDYAAAAFSLAAAADDEQPDLAQPDLAQRVTDYIAGMTDRYCIREYTELQVPRAFER